MNEFIQKIVAIEEKLFAGDPVDNVLPVPNTSTQFFYIYQNEHPEWVQHCDTRKKSFILNVAWHLIRQ